MTMKTKRLTTAQALVEYLIAQRIEADDGGAPTPLFAGAFAIFGHGNVTCLGEALQAAGDALPTWRGQNEQGMGLAAAAFAKAKRRRQIFVATSSIGPGATNMVTAAALAHANRLPVLFLVGDTFVNRLPDPVLQQVENFGDPSATVNDAFRPVARYWDRIVNPHQLLSSLPQAVATMLDAADCGPAVLALPQDAQAEAFDCPLAFLRPTVHRVLRPRPDRDSLAAAADALRQAKRPLVVCGGGVHYALACEEMSRFAHKHGLPVAETIAGRAALLHNDPQNVGPLGVIGSSSANALAAQCDVALAVGTRLQDFTTGSWSVFGARDDFRLIALNAARFDARKHQALALVADAREGLRELSAALGDWRAPSAWGETARALYGEWNSVIDAHSGRDSEGADELPSYAQVVGAVNRASEAGDLALTAAGGFPGELCKNWRARAVGDFDCEFGYSCMGYEVAGGWGAKMADPARAVFVLVGDGSYLMMNSDILSSVMTGRKLIVVVCDNGGYAVIDRLQTGKGGESFNNLFAHCRRAAPGEAADKPGQSGAVEVDFVAHAASMGAAGERVETISQFEAALARAKQSEKTYLIALRVHPKKWTPGDAWWDVGAPEVSARESIREARAAHEKSRADQRVGV